MKNLFWIAGCLAVIGLSACCNCGKVSKNALTLTQNRWNLIEIDNQVIEQDPNNERYSLIFASDNKVNGVGNCNRFFGNYAAENGQQINIDVAGMTRMMCPNLDQEQKFIDLLRQVNRYKIDGDILMLLNDNNIILSFSNVK